MCICVYVTYHWRRTWQPTLLFLPVEFHGHRSLGDYNPWDRRARHDWVTFTHFTHSYICVEVCVYMYVCIYAYTHTCTHIYVYIWMDVLVTQSCLTLWDPMYRACQAPLSMEFPRQDYWCGLPFPSSGDFPDGNPSFLDGSWVSSAAGRLFTIWPSREDCICIHLYTPHLLYPFISWWASILAIVNNAAMNID